MCMSRSCIIRHFTVVSKDNFKEKKQKKPGRIELLVFFENRCSKGFLRLSGYFYLWSNFLAHSTGNNLLTVSYKITWLLSSILSASTVKSSKRQKCFFIVNVSALGGSSLKYHFRMCVNNFKWFHKDFTCKVYFNNDSKIMIATIRLKIFVVLLTFQYFSNTWCNMYFANKGTNSNIY